MPGYQAPVDEAMFLLNDVIGLARHRDLPGFAEATPELFEAISREGARFCQSVLQPLDQSGGREGAVRTPASFKQGVMSLPAELF